MSIRAIWVFGHPGVERGLEKVLLCRRFPTVERRASLIQGDGFVAAPEVADFYEPLAKALGIRLNKIKDPDEFDFQNDPCTKLEQKPVYEVQLKNAVLWPVVVIEKFGLMFACLPLVETKVNSPRPPLIEIPSVSVGYNLLHVITDFIGAWGTKEQLYIDLGAGMSGAEDEEQGSILFRFLVSDQSIFVATGHRNTFKFKLMSKARDLHNFLCVAVPFGTVVDTNPRAVLALMNTKDAVIPVKGKQPAWKPAQHKGKQLIQFTVREEIRAVQYNSSASRDTWQLFGTVSCKADLEGVPEVTANLLSQALDYLVVHPSVQQGDTHLQDLTLPSTQSGGHSNGRKLRFRPPSDPFTLCHYSATAVDGLPMKAIYQMKGDSKMVQISLQLKLNSNVKNQFEYLEIHLPFFNRGAIVRLESAGPSAGTIVVTSDQRRIVWNIGQRFPSKTLEASLSGTVYFGETQSSSSIRDDPFCTDLNAYAQIYFRIPDYSLTGCTVDPRSLVLYPATKYKLSIACEFMTADYKIWNTHGAAMVAFRPPAVTT